MKYSKTICPHCAGRIEFPSHGAGTPIECPHCAASFVLPKVPAFIFEKRPVAILAIITAGALVSIWSFDVVGKKVTQHKHNMEYKQPRQDMRRLLAELKVSLTYGTTRDALREKKKKLLTEYELHGEHLSDHAGFHYAFHDLIETLGHAGYLWTLHIYEADRYRLSENDRAVIEAINHVPPSQFPWQPKPFMRSALSLAAEKVEKVMEMVPE